MKNLDNYTILIQSAVYGMFEEGNENYVNKTELEDPEKATAFLFALSTLVPGLMYNTLTGENLNALHFNHVANHMCFDYLREDKE